MLRWESEGRGLEDGDPHEAAEEHDEAEQREGCLPSPPLFILYIQSVINSKRP